jgi:hypothetical protein
MIDHPLVVAETDAARSKAAGGVPVNAARKALQTCLETIMGKALSWHELPSGDRSEAPHSAIRITTGTGKSEQIRQMLARFIPEAKRLGLPHRVLYLVPTHALGDEARLKMLKGITAALWQGRGVRVLDGTPVCTSKHVETGKPMCLNPDAVHASEAVGAHVEETACRKGQRGSEPILCPFHATCAYQAQKPVAQAADVVFAAHEIAFRLPKVLGDGFGLVVIDEAFWQDGITDARLAIGGLAHELQAFPVREGDKVLDDETAHLRDLIQRLQKALDASPDGYVTADKLREQGLLPSDGLEPGSCTTAARLEWKRKVDVGLRPDTTAERRQKALSQFQFMGQIPRRAAMWKALDELLAGGAGGRLDIETHTTKEGSVRWLRVIGRDDVDETIAGLPLIHADATLHLDLVRHYLPRLELALNLSVETPHMRVAQVIGLPVGKASLQALGGKRIDTEEARVSRKRQRLVDVVRHLVRGRRGLVVTYQAVEDDFRQIEGVEVAHWNAIEGIDRWGDVDVLVTIGRPLPGAEETERMAAALTGKPITIPRRPPKRPGGLPQTMIEQGRAIRLTSGAEHMLKGRVYEVPEAELIRQAVTEAAIVQAVGRARGVNRTAGNPVEVFMVLDDTVTELPVDEVVEFGAIEPDKIDEMIARGLIPQMPTDATKIHRDLFPTREAAKKAYQRGRLSVERGSRLGTSPYREVPIRDCPHARVRYQPQGKGQLPRLALVDPVKVPDARAVLEAALGPLVLFEVLFEAESQAEQKTAPVAVSESRVEPPPREPRQADMFFDAAILEFDYHGGLMRLEQAAIVKAAIKSRGEKQGQLAEVIELSQSHLCNALKGRYPLSPAAAERLVEWMRSSA